MCKYFTCDLMATVEELLDQGEVEDQVAAGASLVEEENARAVRALHQQQRAQQYQPPNHFPDTCKYETVN